MSNHIFSLFIIFVLLMSGTGLAGDRQAPDRNVAHTVVEEIRIYYELIDYEKAFFTEDDRVLLLDDGDVVVPYFQINYIRLNILGFVSELV